MSVDLDLAPAVEALIFAHGDPLGADRISEMLGLEEADALRLIESLCQRYSDDSSGIELLNIGGKFQFRTKGRYSELLRVLKQERPRKLSVAALETLAIIAYRQPIIKSDIERIRGVDATPTIKTLLERSLIRIIGHQSTVGQPALYGTTEEFLKIFGLGSLLELPTLRDLSEIDRDPGEVQEEGEESPEEPIAANT